MNHINDKLTPWRIAVARRAFVTAVTLPIIWPECFWRTWYEVFRSGDE